MQQLFVKQANALFYGVTCSFNRSNYLLILLLVDVSAFS